MSRFRSVDLLRGIVMVIMALDHVRDFFHFDTFLHDPLDMKTTTPALFATRWITHFCAPVFVFLSGMSIWFQAKRKPVRDLRRFLLTRGLWLILLDLVVMSLVMTADPMYSALVLQVLWAIGISMVILALLIRVPYPYLLALGLLIVFGHNLADPFDARNDGIPVWWRMMHIQSILPLGEKNILFLMYPFLPWTGVMLLGYCSGRLLTDLDAARSRKWLLGLGISAIVLFIILRWPNLYGDASAWSPQKNLLFSFFSFINVSKYPPSLLYVLVTIGPALIFLALVKPVEGAVAGFFATFGRVPMFYYLLHFFIIRVASIGYYLWQGHSLQEGLTGQEGNPFRFVSPGEGFGLLGVWMIWIVLVLLAYPICKRYDAYKRAHPGKVWLQYL